MRGSDKGKAVQPPPTTRYTGEKKEASVSIEN
jgi:hypothetical protein